jgi:arginine/lysine/ornithine decarboxylase
MLTSTHKIAGSLTQSAMLHIGHEARIDGGALARAVRLVRSTSPSSLLLASLDGARRQLALHGEQLLHETLQAIAAAREKLQTIPDIALVDSAFVGRPGVAGYDPLRIVVDVRETGRTGYEIAEALRRSYDVNPELATQATIVFVVGIGERREALIRLAGDVEEVVKRLAVAGGTTAAIIRPPASLRNEMAVAPREAFLGAAEEVAVDDAVGRVSCESVAGYPPGIPALLPGERISAETVAYLRELVASGARLHGASDPSFERVHVLVES